MCVAPNRFSVSPDHLGEMAPGLEVAHVGIVVAVVGGIMGFLAVVEAVRENRRNITSLSTGSDVLAITSSTWCPDIVSRFSYINVGLAYRSCCQTQV